MSRPPETWPDPEGPKPAYVELIDLRPSDDGPRVQIPAPGRGCVEWPREQESRAALVEIAEPGRIRVLSWKYGQTVVSRLRELGRVDDEGSEELLLLVERYRRVTIEKNGRFPLHDRELFHLGLGPITGW